MIAIADILQAGEKLTAVAPFLAGIQNEEQYTQALELVDHLLLNDPENPLLKMVCAKITAWEESAPEFAEFNAMAQAMPGGCRRDSYPYGSIWFNPFRSRKLAVNLCSIAF